MLIDPGKRREEKVREYWGAGRLCVAGRKKKRKEEIGRER